jgi:hypothetical protein
MQPGSMQPGPRGERIRAFEGVSRARDESTAESLHEAIQLAAQEAARVLADEGEDLPQVFELSRIRVVVGNPNVKWYSATITKGGSG